MTWPIEYKNACNVLERFMVAARDAAGLQTTNMAWTMVEGVLLTFRRRLTADQVMRFAAVLPPLIRALFLERWMPDDRPVPFESPERLAAEVQSLRAAHNFAPPDAIRAVAQALRANVDEAELDQTLASLPLPAQAYWAAGDPTE